MTVPFPLDAFEGAQLVRPRHLHAPGRRSRLASIGITIALHAVIVAGALTAVHVANPKRQQVLMVQITPEKQKPAEDIAPPPPLVKPTIIAMPLPEVVVQTPVPPPIVAQPVVSRPSPPTVAPQGGTGESRQTFLAKLLAQLNRFKQYPRSARQAHIEGVVMLHFVMNADGRVTSFEIARSSGRPILDNEALALIQRAQPLPAIPADYPTRTLDAVVPIEFSLNR